MTDKELLELLLEGTKNMMKEPDVIQISTYTSGLCETIIWLDLEEGLKLRLKELIYSLPHPIREESNYWWPIYAKIPRIKWLKKQIKKM